MYTINILQIKTFALYYSRLIKWKDIYIYVVYGGIMHQEQCIKDNLYYVGAGDRRQRLFENTYPIPYGMAYNSYLILDEKTILGSLTATDSLYKPETLIKTGFQSYFFVNLFVILCSYL